MPKELPPASAAARGVCRAVCRAGAMLLCETVRRTRTALFLHYSKSCGEIQSEKAAPCAMRRIFRDIPEILRPLPPFLGKKAGRFA